MQGAFKLIFILCITIMSIRLSSGQPIVFSQQYASPLQLNPAFAGSKPFTRMAFGYRTLNFPNFNAFQSMHFSIDGFNQGMLGGLGILFIRDVQANIVHTNKISGAYSLHLQIANNLFMNLAVDAGVINMGLKWNNLIFSDQINLITGEILQINEPNIADDIWAPNFSTGMLLFSNRLFGGIALHYLNRPNLSLVGNQKRIPIRYTAKMGGYFSLESVVFPTRTLERFFVSPNIIFNFHGVNTIMNYGLYFGLSNVFAGIWLRKDFALPETLILMLGLRTGNFRFSYSFDHALSGFSGIRHGAHEIALSFSIMNNHEKTRGNVINSPDF